MILPEAVRNIIATAARCAARRRRGRNRRREYVKAYCRTSALAIRILKAK